MQVPTFDNRYDPVRIFAIVFIPEEEFVTYSQDNAGEQETVKSW